jgi:precorrin-6Y C5,15-methyltransferase (decarboxylating)
MMEKAVRYLSPDGCIVMNSVKAPRVLTDSQQLWDEACQQLGLREEPPLHIQLNDYHPITILKCKK